MKTSEIIAAVENGAKWQYLTTRHENWETDENLGITNLMARIVAGWQVRLTPQKKTVPLGPEDWEGIWWVRNTQNKQDFKPRHLVSLISGTYVASTTSSGIPYEELKHGWQRSRDGKTWEPCHKEEES